MTRYLFLASLLFSSLPIESSHAADTGQPPAIGEQAPDFNLLTLAGEKVHLGELLKSGPVVLVVLRGYPGYQCPACTAQAGDYLARGKQFAAVKANVVLVYPGPAKGLADHARDFVRGKTLPENCFLVTDPDYALTTSYGLRWERSGETAYPATLVINAAGKVLWSKVSRSHGDRTKAAAVLEVLRKR